MPFFETIDRLAVVGSDRQPMPDELQKQLAALGFESSGDAARDLLAALAVASRLRKAGNVLAEKTSPTGPAAAPETWPEAAPEAARALDLMLRGAHRECLEEWLAAACHFQKTVQKQAIPPLLGLFFEKKIDFSRRGPALGERGKWLAARHPDCKNLLGKTPAAADFDDASHAERLLFFENERKKDAASSVDFLQKFWPDESPEHRLQFLKLLENGLSLADEPFLERAAADRRKEIRRAAIEFLARIDGSRLAAEIEKMLERLLVFDKKTGLPEVDWSFDFEKSAPAVLAENFGSAKAASAKSALLGEFLAILPLKMFEKRLQKAETEAVALVLQSQSAGLLMPLLISKTDSEKAESWSLALVRAWAERPDLAVWSCEPFVRLLQNLPSKVFSDEVGRAFSERHFLFDAGGPLAKSLGAEKAPFWSRGMTLAAFQHVHFWLDRSSELTWNGWFLEQTLQKMAFRAAPECAEQLRQLFLGEPFSKRTSSVSARVWNQVFGTMEFRGRFRRSLAA